MKKLIEIVKVEAPVQASANMDYSSKITIKNNVYSPLVFRYDHTVNGKTTRHFGFIRAKKTITLPIKTRAEDIGTEYHELSIKFFLIFQDKTEWYVEIVEEAPSAEIIQTEFSAI